MRGPSRGVVAPGIASTNDAPEPGLGTAHRRHPFSLGEAARDREAETRPAPSGRSLLEGLEDPFEVVVGEPGPAVVGADDRTSSPATATVTSTGSDGDDRRSAFSITFASARSSCAASTRTGGAPPASRTRTRSASGPRVSSARETSSSTAHSSGRGCAAPASSRERSSRFATRRSRRAVSSRIVSSSAARSSSSRSSDELSRPPEAARIAVRGERRSWLTAWRTAVLTASLRRRASASAAAIARRRATAASSLTTTAVTR